MPTAVPSWNSKFDPRGFVLMEELQDSKALNLIHTADGQNPALPIIRNIP